LRAISEKIPFETLAVETLAAEAGHPNDSELASEFPQFPLVRYQSGDEFLGTKRQETRGGAACTACIEDGRAQHGSSWTWACAGSHGLAVAAALVALQV
jgi:hypothetical protein